MRARSALGLAAVLIGLVVTPAAADLPRKAPRASLVQILLGGRQALVLDRATGDYQVVKVGDAVQGFRITEIEADQIVLTNPAAPERFFVLPLVNPSGPVTGHDPAAVADGITAAALGAGAGGASAGAGAPAQPATAPAGAAAADPERADVLDPYGGDVAAAVLDHGDAATPLSGAVPSVIAPSGSRAFVGPDPAASAPAQPPRANAEVELGMLDPVLNSGSGSVPGSGSLAGAGLAPGPGPASPAGAGSGAKLGAHVDSQARALEPTPVQPGAAGQSAALPLPPEQRRKLSRRQLDAALSDFAALSKQMQIERAAGGGVRIVKFERGSFLAQLGIERGDVVRRVAGHPVDNVDEAAAAYAAVSSAAEVLVEIERGGAPLRIRYQLTR